MISIVAKFPLVFTAVGAKKIIWNYLFGKKAPSVGAFFEGQTTSTQFLSFLINFCASEDRGNREGERLKNKNKTNRNKNQAKTKQKCLRENYQC